MRGNSYAAIAAGALLTVGNLAMAETVYEFAPAPGFGEDPVLGVWFESDVRPGGMAAIADLSGETGNLGTQQPLPRGAAQLTTDLTNAAKAEVAVVNSFGTVAQLVNNLTIGYSWHKATNPAVPGTGEVAANLNVAPSIKLTFFNPDCSGTGIDGCFTTFVYEPYQNGFGNFPDQDVWQRSEMNWTTGSWWTTGGFGVANGFGGCGAAICPTLAEWAGTLNADFATAQLIAVKVGVGSYNPGQIGYFDSVAIGGTLADATYDFEPPAAFESVGECVSTLIAESCAGQTGRDRANCNHAQQMTCFDIFGVK